jgi:hypothetical protein
LVVLRVHGVSGSIRVQLGSLTILSLDCFVYFLAVNWDLDGCIDSQSHLIATDIDHRDHNVIADDDAFIAMS